MEVALVQMVDDILSGKSDPIANLVSMEQSRGFRIIRPGQAPWFRATDWRAASVASIDGKRARLVLLHAFQSGKGAFTRTISGILAAGLAPSVIEPTHELAEALQRRGWRERRLSSGMRETIWYPRK